MALLHVDGFDHYAAVGDILLGKWTSGTTTSVAMTSSTRFSAGQAVTFNATTQFITKDLGTNYTTLVVGAAINPGASGSPTITFLDSTATSQFTFTLNATSNAWEARRGAANNTIIGTSSTSGAVNSWHYYEFKITVNSTTGSCSVKMDGTTTLLSLTGQNTQATANTNIRYVRVTANANASFSIDDWYVCDTSGSRNNDFLGDVRVETLYPNGDTAQKDFTSLIALGNYRLAFGASSNMTANNVYVVKVTPAGSGNLTAINIFTTVSSASLKFKAVCYSDAAGVPGTLLGTGNETVSITTSTTTPNTSSFASAVALTGGTAYWIGIMLDTTAGCYQGTAGLTFSSFAQTYTSGPPSTAPTATVGAVPFYLYGNYSGSGVNYPAVLDTTPDNDVTYVASSTVNAADLYDVGNLSSVPTSVFGVQVNGYVKKDDAGARTAALLLKSGSTTTTGATVTPGTSYSYASLLTETDPNIAGDWTGTTVNALTAGVKVIS